MKRSQKRPRGAGAAGTSGSLIAANDEAHAPGGKLTAYLPSNNAEDAPVVPSGDALTDCATALRELVPVNPNVPMIFASYPSCVR